MRKKIQATERVYSSVDELVKEIGGEVECHYAVALGRIKSPAKAKAARRNGKLGGRPAKSQTQSQARAQAAPRAPSAQARAR